jgi:hypothetical protein
MHERVVLSLSLVSLSITGMSLSILTIDRIPAILLGTTGHLSDAVWATLIAMLVFDGETLRILVQ